MCVRKRKFVMSHGHKQQRNNGERGWGAGSIACRELLTLQKKTESLSLTLHSLYPLTATYSLVVNMKQNCCASLAKKWEIAGIKVVQLSCVYGVPIISDSGRKDSVTLSRTTKTQERCWSSCVYNSHTVGAVTAIYSHLTVTNAHIQGQTVMTMDYDCDRDHNKLKLIADRKKARRYAHIPQEKWSSVGGM